MWAIEGFFIYLRDMRLKPDDVEMTDSKGYWAVKGGCRGGLECRHAFRGELGPCEGGTRLTIYYAEHGVRERNGRWVSPYRIWEMIKSNVNG